VHHVNCTLGGNFDRDVVGQFSVRISKHAELQTAG
jgi:hypothetical protein